MEQQGEYVAETQEALEMLGKGYNEPQEIIDESDLRKYRIELPNLYDDSDLDVYEFRLLAHYKRVGRCTESTSTTSKKTHMSAGQVSQKRQSLYDKGFIVMKTVYLDDEHKTYSYKITVVDKWRENFERYYDPSRGEGYPSLSETPPSPHETKNTDDEALSKIAKAYESEIGIITSMIADDLKDASTTYPLKWIQDAIHEAAVQNKRGWKYCLAILKRWKAQGNQDTAKKAAPAPAPTMPDFGDLEARYGI